MLRQPGTSLAVTRYVRTERSDQPGFMLGLDNRGVTLPICALIKLEYAVLKINLQNEQAYSTNIPLSST